MISFGDLTRSHAGQFSLPSGVNLRFCARINISLQQFNGNPAHAAVSVARGNVPGA